MKITVSVIKADVGGIGGHTRPSDGLLNAIRKTVKDAEGLLIDHYIGYCGDDSHIVMSHTNGVNNKEIHQIAWDAFMAGTEVAKKEGLYGAGQDLLIDHYIGYCGDDSHIVMTHTKGIDNEEIHQLAWNAFMAGTKVAKEEGLYGAGQDLLKDSFSVSFKQEWVNKKMDCIGEI